MSHEQLAAVLEQLQAAIDAQEILIAQLSRGVESARSGRPAITGLRVTQAMPAHPLRTFVAQAGHRMIGAACLACQLPISEGDHTTLLALGPGSDAEARRHARVGRPYDAVALVLHRACVTGADEAEART